MSDSGGQVTFVGCFAEPAELNRLINGGAVWVGGSSGTGASRLLLLDPE
jgi:hypothetical protein